MNNPFKYTTEHLIRYKSKVKEEVKKQETSEKNLKDAITQIRTCIQNLGNKGFYINVEEIDFDTNYQITIQINKDN